jgi:hypothetical protein
VTGFMNAAFGLRAGFLAAFLAMVFGFDFGFFPLKRISF